MAHPLEIGRSLREARTARGLTLEAVEKETKIRARYLGALEGERFAELPAEAYARGFLRTYADHLGLDGQEVLAAYRARERQPDDVPVTPRPQRPYERRRFGPALAGLAAALVLLVSSLVAWRLGDGEPGRAGSSTPAAAPQPAPVPTARLVVTTAGRTSLQIRVGDAAGRQVWTGTLRPGQRLRLGLGRPLWLRAGTPELLRLDVAGSARRLPPGAAGVIVARTGISRD